MTKIVLNGAGSVEFTKELLADILGFDELAGSTIALCDTSGERLETAAAIARCWAVKNEAVPSSMAAMISASNARGASSSSSFSGSGSNSV